jgi:pimeloyl-ACP methyl ester carboxylesterase
MSGMEATPPELTRRERDVLTALCRPALDGGVFAEPASVRQIATALVVTEAAIKQHLLHLYDKFGIAETGERRRVRLAREAIRSGAVAFRDSPREASISKVPEIRYVRSGDVNIAYQIIGEGPIDLVFVPGFISNLEAAWWHPSMAAFYRRLARFSRLIVFDKRGTGMSDRVSNIADLETRMDDVRAVMDAARSSRAALLGYSEGGSMAALFAAMHPERTLGLLLYGALVALRWSPETPWALTREDFDRWVADIETRWGTAEYCDEQLAADAPSRAGDEAFRRWYATRLRLGASPSAAAAAVRMAAESDIAGILPAIRVPTLILHRSDDRLVPVESGRYLGLHIPGARYIELAGADHLPWVGDTEALARPVESFWRTSIATTSLNPTAPSRRCSSWTSSARHRRQWISAMPAGASCSSAITR